MRKQSVFQGTHVYQQKVQSLQTGSQKYGFEISVKSRKTTSTCKRREQKYASGILSHKSARRTGLYLEKCA